MKALLIDDDSVCNFLNKKTLERTGFVNDIQTVLNGKEAIDLFNSYYQESRQLPDIVLLDLNMPIMDGFGFLEAFKRLPSADKENVKIIVVTSSQDPKDISRAKELGIKQYLIKPLMEESLRVALTR
jgi:CheY-like chemotaxis protein